MPRVTLERGMPGGDGAGVLSLVGANAPEQIVGIGECGIMHQSRHRDGRGGLQLATLAQALPQFKKGEPL